MATSKNETRIAEALERIAAALESGPQANRKYTLAAVEAPKAKAKQAAPEVKLTQDDVKEALMKLNKARSSQVSRELLGEFDANRLSQLDSSNYAAVIARAEQLCDE